MAIRGQRFNPNAAPEQPPPPRKPESPASYVAPVDRQSIDRFKPGFFLCVAAVFFVLSLISTVAQVGVILKIGGVQLVSWQMIAAGLAVATIISIGEIDNGLFSAIMTVN